MARPLRIAVPGGVYHVVARGNARQRIFRDATDRQGFIAAAHEVRARYGWRFLTYCLMGNHYHLVVQTPRPNLPRGMRQLNGVYARRFNSRHRRVGHLFAGRYKAVLVQEDRHLTEVARYVAMNPVRAKLCSSPEDWRWSAHRVLVGLASSDELVEPNILLAYFGRDQSAQRRRYAAFVAEGGRKGSAPSGRAIWGDREFVAANVPAALHPEVPRRQRLGAPLPLPEILADQDRDRAIARAHRDHGYLLREIADSLGCHHSTVSRRLRAYESRGSGTSEA